MLSVVQPGGNGDCGGVAALRKRPGRCRAAQRKPSGCRGTTWARTASLTRRKPERAGTKAAPEVIKEGNRLFRDMPFKDTWKVYHDALPQWWEKGAQAFMEEQGFKDRQWRCNGFTNLLVAKYYRNKLMGDSPELMPLDSSLFNDLIEGVALHVVGSTTLEKGKRYLMGLPNDAWRTMCEVWEKAPSSARVIQDVDRFLVALHKIIAAEGCYVEEYDAHHGHRKAMQKAVKGGGGVQHYGLLVKTY